MWKMQREMFGKDDEIRELSGIKSNASVDVL